MPHARPVPFRCDAVKYNIEQLTRLFTTISGPKVFDFVVVWVLLSGSPSLCLSVCLSVRLSVSLPSVEKIEHMRLVHEAELAEMDRRLKERGADSSRLEEKLRGVEEAKIREVQGMRQTLDLAIAQLQTQTQDVVDRRLMANLVLQYHTKNRSPEVLELLARILGLNEDEKRAIGLIRSRGILGGLIAPLPPPDISAEEVGSSNLVELWVRFLEDETGAGGGPASKS